MSTSDPPKHWIAFPDGIFLPPIPGIHDRKLTPGEKAGSWLRERSGVLIAYGRHSLTKLSRNTLHRFPLTGSIDPRAGLNEWKALAQALSASDTSIQLNDRRIVEDWYIAHDLKVPIAHWDVVDGFGNESAFGLRLILQGESLFLAKSLQGPRWMRVEVAIRNRAGFPVIVLEGSVSLNSLLEDDRSTDDGRSLLSENGRIEIVSWTKSADILQISEIHFVPYLSRLCKLGGF